MHASFFFFTVLCGTPLVSHLYKQKEAREGVGWWVVLGGVEDTPLLPYYKACYGLGLELGPGSDASYIRRRAKSAQILFRRHRIRPVDRTRINTCKSPLYVAGVARGNACGASCCAFMARSKRRTKCHLVRDLSRARGLQEECPCRRARQKASFLHITQHRPHRRQLRNMPPLSPGTDESAWDRRDLTWQ